MSLESKIDELNTNLKTLISVMQAEAAIVTEQAQVTTDEQIDDAIRAVEACEPEPEPDTPEPATKEEVRAALIKLSEAKGRAASVEIVGNYTPKGAPVKLDSIPEERYSELIREVNELIAAGE